MALKLQEIADHIGAELLPGEGETTAESSQRVVSGVAGIDDCPADRITFVANPKYASLARESRAAAIIVEPEFPAIRTATLRIKNPYLAWAKAIELFNPAPVYSPGIHPTAVIAESASIGARAHVGAYVVVGEGCVIGADAVLLPQVVVYSGVTIGERFFAHAQAVVRENCVVGNDVVLQNGVVVGGDGFGFAKGEDGRWVKIVQAGPVVLEDFVEIQANSCIDRASVGETRIKSGAKIDNLVQVGHGSSVGQDTLLCSQVGLAGSTVVGKNVILAGQVGVAGHLTVGDGAIATAQTGIPSDVAPGAVVSGYPAMDNREWLRMVTALKRVPDLLRKLRS